MGSRVRIQIFDILHFVREVWIPYGRHRLGIIQALRLPCFDPPWLNIQVRSIELVVKIVHIFSFDTKNKRSRVEFKLERVLMWRVIVKYSYHFLGDLLVELQWYVNQNKIAVGFLEITFYLLGKVTSLLGERSAFFSVIASKSFKSSLFGIFRTRLELKAWSPLKSQGSQAHVCEHFLSFPPMLWSCNDCKY